MDRLLTRFVTTKSIQYAIWLALIVLVGIVLLFGGYYYSDRYIHRDNQSLVDRQIDHLEDDIRANPEELGARVALADYYLSIGMDKEAFELADQILQVYPDNEGGQLIFGIAAVRLGQPNTAVPPLEKFIARRSTHPMANADLALQAAYYFLGESYLKLDQPSEAVPVLEAALAISGVDADALYQLGLAYQATGRSEEALTAYHKAVALVPDFTEVYKGMVDSYTTLNWGDHINYAQGMVAFSSQDYESALNYLVPATQALPDFSAAYLGLALTYEALGQPAEAEAAVWRTLKLSPDNIAARRALVRIQTNSHSAIKD